MIRPLIQAGASDARNRATPVTCMRDSWWRSIAAPMPRELPVTKASFPVSGALVLCYLPTSAMMFPSGSLNHAAFDLPVRWMSPCRVTPGIS